jgi:hypothetical protein
MPDSWHILERSVEDISRGLTRDVGMIWRWGRARAARARQKREAREAEDRARREALKEQRKSEKQQKEWLAQISREKTFGDAGNATEAEAMEMARGRVGRRNPLDDRKF